MYRIIGADGREYGPVPAEEIHAWIRENRVNGQTRIQIDGSTEWQAVGEFAEFADELRATGQSPPPPPLPVVLSPEAEVEAALDRETTLDVGECLGRGWQVMASNVGLLFAVVLLVLAVRLLCDSLGFLAGRIPIMGNLMGLVGSLIGLTISGALQAGLCGVFLKRVRGEPASVGDALAGFDSNFVQFMLAGVVITIPTAIGYALCVLPGFLLHVIWVFTFVLMIDKRLSFWPAMESSRRMAMRHFPSVAFLLLIVFLPIALWRLYGMVRGIDLMLSQFGGSAFPRPDQVIARMGEIMRPMTLLSIKLHFGEQILRLFTLPFAFAVLMQAYETLFGTRPKTSA